MEHPLNIYITAHTLISSLGFGTEENLKAIRTYRSGVHLQETGPDSESNRISDTPIQAGLIDSAELEKRARQAQIEAYPRLEQLFILTIQEILSQSEADLCKQDCALLLSTTKGNIDLLGDSPVFLGKMAERIGGFFRTANRVEVIS